MRTPPQNSAKKSSGSGETALAPPRAPTPSDEPSAPQDDDDDDDLETDALKAENARLKLRSALDDGFGGAERDGNNYRNDARDARKKLAALKRAQDEEDDSTKKAEADLRRDLADAQAGAAKASEIAKAARAAELKLQTALDEERRKAATLTEQLGDARHHCSTHKARGARDADAARRGARRNWTRSRSLAALAAAKAEPAAPVDHDDGQASRQDDRYAR